MFAFLVGFGHVHATYLTWTHSSRGRVHMQGMKERESSGTGLVAYVRYFYLDRLKFLLVFHWLFHVLAT